MFRVDSFDVVDATTCGDAARFINHSCEVKYTFSLRIRNFSALFPWVSIKGRKEELAPPMKVFVSKGTDDIKGITADKNLMKYLSSQQPILIGWQKM